MQLLNPRIGWSEFSNSSFIYTALFIHEMQRKVLHMLTQIEANTRVTHVYVHHAHKTHTYTLT